MQVSVSFDTAADDMNEVLDTVERIYLATEGMPATATPAGAPLVIPANAPIGTQPMTQQQAAAGAPAAAVQRDADGLPWDARIHTTPAKIGANGKWAAKRKLDAAMVAAVQAELRGAAPAPATFQQPQQPAQAAATGAVPGLQAPGALAPLSAPPAAAPSGYQELVALFGQQLQTQENPNGRMPADWARSSLQTMGVPNGQLEAVAAMPDEQARQIVTAFKNALGL